MLKQSQHFERVKSVAWKATIVVVVIFSFAYPFFNLPVGLFPEKPIQATVEQTLPDFKTIENIKEKKTAFFQYLMPEVKRQNDYLMVLRLTVKAIFDDFEEKGKLTDFQRRQLEWLQNEYRVDDKLSLENQFKQLLRKVDIIPKDLVLVQAANESAWGVSRFAQQGYNFYGLWCFKTGCGFVPRKRDEGAAHEVAKFNNLAQATYTYMRNLNRHPAYKHLRDIRSKLRTHQKPITGMALSEGLIQYSERGEDYIDELQQMIRFNEEFMEL